MGRARAGLRLEVGADPWGLGDGLALGTPWGSARCTGHGHGPRVPKRSPSLTQGHLVVRRGRGGGGRGGARGAGRRGLGHTGLPPRAWHGGRGRGTCPGAPKHAPPPQRPPAHTPAPRGGRMGRQPPARPPWTPQRAGVMKVRGRGSLRRTRDGRGSGDSPLPQRPAAPYTPLGRERLQAPSTHIERWQLRWRARPPRPRAAPAQPLRRRRRARATARLRTTWAVGPRPRAAGHDTGPRPWSLLGSTTWICRQTTGHGGPRRRQAAPAPPPGTPQRTAVGPGSGARPSG
jgi:hypothetical protein